ncbi:hypothetical protein TrST_g9673 [Triparma strigata]|uniref:Uncharacterized protein n=1 Tax=Triparma strigata TaxID=1606541 RepID=A0A9W7A354_9STRA|nr:hypothetical protein TrST_g9673 [Triparma strigata]
MSSAKGLNKTSSTNTHRFISDKKASKSISLDPYDKRKNLKHHIEEDYDQDAETIDVVKDWSRTRKAIEEEKEMNPVDIVKEVCWKLSKKTLTLPILLHNSKSLLQYFLELLSRPPQSLLTSYSSIFKIYAPLLLESSPLPPDTLSLHLNLLKNLITSPLITSSLPLLQSAFLPLTSLLSSSPSLSSNSFRPLRSLYSLLSHPLERVRRLSSQSLCVPLRSSTLKDHTKHWSHVTKILASNSTPTHLTHGLSLLVLHTLKSSSGSLTKSAPPKLSSIISSCYSSPSPNVNLFLTSTLLELSRWLKSSPSYMSVLVNTVVECEGGVGKVIAVKRVMGFNPVVNVKRIMDVYGGQVEEIVEKGKGREKVSLICLILKYGEEEELMGKVRESIDTECDLEEILKTVEGRGGEEQNVVEKIIEVAGDDWKVLEMAYEMYEGEKFKEGEEEVWRKRIFDEKLPAEKLHQATGIYKHMYRTQNKKTNAKIERAIRASADDVRVALLIDLISTDPGSATTAQGIFPDMIEKWSKSQPVLTSLAKITSSHPSPSSLNPPASTSASAPPIYTLLGSNLRSPPLRPSTLTILQNLSPHPLFPRLSLQSPIEASPTIQNYRSLNSATSTLASHINLHPAEEEVPLLVSWIVGLLNVKFKEIWATAVEALTGLMDNEEVRDEVWEAVWSELKRVRKREGAEGQTDEETVEKMLFEVLEGAPKAVVKYHSTFVPSFFEFLTQVYYNVHGTKSDFHEIKFPPSYTLNTSTTPTFTSSQPIKESTSTLTNYLKVFASINGPNQLSHHSTLLKIHTCFLTNPSPTISTLSIKAILKYKFPSLTPYADFLTSLTSSDNFRETLTTFNLHKIPQQHRLTMSKITTRILYGKLNSKSGKGKRSKDTPETRRQSVMGWLTAFDEVEIQEFMYCVFKGFAKMEYDLEGGWEDFKVVLEGSGVGDGEGGRIIGFLNMCKGIMGKLGFKVREWVEVMAGMMMKILEYSEVEGTTTGEVDLEEVEEEGEEDIEDHTLGKKFIKDKRASIRSLTIKRLSEFFALYSTMMPMEQHGKRLFKALETSIKKLPKTVISMEAKTSAPALLSLLETLSSSVPLLDIFEDQNAMPTIIACINPQTSPQSLDVALKIVSNALAMKPELVKQHLTEIVEAMSELVGETTRKNGALETKQLTILCDICELLGDSVEGVSKDTLLTLVTVLLPFLDQSNRSSSRDEYQQLNVLGIVSSFLPSIPAAERRSTIPMLSKLLGPIKSKQGVTSFGVRSGLVDCSSKAVGEATQASKDLQDLNSRSSKYVEEHDFNKVLPVLNKLGSPSGWKGYSDARDALPLLFTVLHYVYDGDGVLSRGAFKAIKAFVSFAGQMKEDGGWLRVLETSVVPVMKNGIVSKVETPRKSFILTFRALAKTFGSEGENPDASPLLFGDLESLVKEDDEVDFFLNVTHVQVHRRARALAKLRKELEASDEASRSARFSPASLTNFLAPVCTHPIFEATKSTDEAAALEGGATLGALAKNMRWGAYSTTLGLFFAQIPRHPEVERFLVAAMCKVLDNFNFDLGEVGSVAMNGIEKLMEKIEKLLYVEGKDKAGSRTKTMRAAVALALLKLYQKLPTEAFEVKFENLVLSVCRELKSKESNSRDIARATLGRMSVAAGLENFGVVLRNLEVTLGEGYQLHVRSAALHTCVLALSQNAEVKEAANGGTGGLDAHVPDIMKLVLADIFGIAAEMKESKDVGKRIIKEAVGVRSYDTLEILTGIIRFRPEDEGSAVQAVVGPLIEKLSEDDSKINLAVIKKVREALNKAVIGFSKNEDAESETVLKFVLDTIRDVLGDGEGDKTGKRKRGENHDDDEDEDDADLEESDSDGEEEKGPIKITTKGGKLKDANKAKKAKKNKGSVETWQPSMHTVHNKKTARDAAKAESRQESIALDGAQAPKLTGTGRHGKSRMADGKGLNDPAVSCGVVFGLKFLHACLKKGKIDWNSSVVKERAAPFVTILTRCVKRSTSDEVVVLAIRCLGFLLRWDDMPTVKENRGALASGSLKILTKGGIGGSKDEVVQGIFKVLTFLFKMKDKSSFLLNDKQMRALVGLLRATVADTSHHNSTFGLIAAIVGMRVVNLEIYDLMDDVLDLVVQSTNPSVRSLGASTFTSFILNYELGEKKVESLLNRIVGNCKYEFDDGRASGLDMLNKVLSNLKPVMLNANADKFFLPLVLQLHNDGSSVCKEKCGDVLGSLLKRVNEEKMKDFFGIVKAWSDKEETRVVALKVLGIVCDARAKWVKGGRRAEIERILVGAIEGEMETGEEGKGDRFGEDWERVYFALVGLEKFGGGSVGAEVVSCLSHYHPWCKLVSGRIVSGGLKKGLKGVKAGYYELVKGFGGQIDVDAKFTNDNVAMGAIRGVIAVVKLMKGGEEDAERAKKWLFNRLAGAAKKSSGGVRMNIFKTFAGLVQVCDVHLYLGLILGSLHRAISEADAVNNETEENVVFMKELLGVIEDKVGTDVFMKAYADVRTKAKERRDARKSEIAIEKVVDPVAAAQRKIKKKEAEQGRKKRRFEEKKNNRGSGGQGGGFSGKKNRRGL